MKKLLHFEGLRGVAAFIVYLAHFRPTFCYTIEFQILDHLGLTGIRQRAFFENLMRTFYEGTLPVFIFWFMSAYVISIKLFNTEKNRDNLYLVEASTKRYFRLGIPVFFSSLICFILIKTHLLFNHQLASIEGKGYVDGWLNNWYDFNPDILHFLRTTIIEVWIPGNSNYNMAFWTMNSELFGSFLCLGLFAISGKNKFRFIIYLALEIFLTIAGFIDESYFYSFIFVCGLMWSDANNSVDTRVYLKDNIKNVLNSNLFTTIILIAGFAVPVYSDVFYPIHESLYYFFAFPLKAIGITLMIHNFGIFRKLFSIKPLTFMGKISFSFYLIHIPVLFSLGIYLYMYAGITSPHKLAIIFFTVSAVLIFLSWLFMKFIDRNSIILSDRIGKFFSKNKGAE